MTLKELKEKAYNDLRLKLARILLDFDKFDDGFAGTIAINKIFQAFIQFCEEQNIYQVVEGELPEITDDKASAAIAIYKWHKQSLKPVSGLSKEVNQ